MKLALALRRSSAARLSIEFGIHDFIREHTEIELVRVDGNHSLSWEDALKNFPDALLGFFHHPDHFRKVREMGIPSVCINSVFDHGSVSCVRSDAYAVGVAAAEHFLEQGCNDFTYISDVPHHHYSVQRQAGFYDTLEKNGFHANCITSESLEPAALWLEKKLVKKKQSAIFCVNDRTARSLLNLLEVNHPNLEDFLIFLGVDNDPFYYENGAVIFSSIDVDHRQVGYRAAELLYKHYQEEDSTATCIEIPPLGLIDRYQQAQHLQHQHPALSQAFKKIASEYANSELNAEAVAKHCSLSIRSLNRILKAHDYSPLSACILDARVRAAKKLLERSNLTLDQIAFTVGFKEYTTFFRAFKKNEGIAPSNYR